MFVVYIVIAAFVTALLLSGVLFPFWKVWERLKTHHPDIWRAAGPFELMSMIASPGLVGIFISVLIRMAADKELQARDPSLGKWVHICMEVLRMVPRTFLARVGCFIVFVCVINMLTSFLIRY